MENRSIHDVVWLAPWDPEWAREFHMEKQCIVGSMMAEEHSAFVRHVGSTAIEGMPAKPMPSAEMHPHLSSNIAQICQINFSKTVKQNITKLSNKAYNHFGSIIFSM